MLVGRALSCVALSQIRPLQHHLVRTHNTKNFAQETAAQWATGSRRSSFVRLCKRSIPIPLGWSCNGTIFTQILLSLLKVHKV
jgi:hypothetical protein